MVEHIVAVVTDYDERLRKCAYVHTFSGCTLERRSKDGRHHGCNAERRPHYIREVVWWGR